jgi:hypothetical protein
LVKASSAPDRLDIAPFSHPLRFELLSALTDEQLGAGMHIVTESGEIRTGPEALTRLIEVVAPLLRGVPLVNVSSRRAYVAVSANRSRLARFVPNVEPVVRVSIRS